MDDLSEIMFGPWMLLGPLAFLLFIAGALRLLSWRGMRRALSAPDVPAVGVAALAVLMSSEPRWVEAHQLDFVFAVAAFLLWIAATIVFSRESRNLSPVDRH